MVATSPGDNGSADAIARLTARGNLLLRATLYVSHGDNVVLAQAQDWRHHAHGCRRAAPVVRACSETRSHLYRWARLCNTAYGIRGNCQRLLEYRAGCLDHLSARRHPHTSASRQPELEPARTMRPSRTWPL